MAGETKPYRFLLRMSAELGDRLRTAAESSGRSINREIVARLEASLDEEAAVARSEGARRMRVRSLERGRGMTRRRRQALVACALAVVVAAIAAAALTLPSSPTAAPTGGGELPTAIAQHLAGLNAAPHAKNPGGPASWEEEQDLARAYPAESVSAAAIENARSSWSSLKGRPFTRGKGRDGTWVSVGPTTALYPESPFRTRNLYVAGKYEAGGRMTSVAIAPTCKPGNCRLWIGAAGGGVWRTDNALAGTPHWTFLSGSFELNAIGSITLDPNDASGNTLYVGTGEANAAGSAAAGVGIYKSTDGGNTWTKLPSAPFVSRAVGSIAIEPGDANTIYAATTRAVRGISATTSGAVSLIPGAAKWGLYKSTDGGQTWTFIHNGSADENACTGDANEGGGGTPCSPRGVRRVAIDPNNPDVVYAGSFARGVWRSIDAGANWTQIFAPILAIPATGFTERPEFALADLGTKTRMYLQIGETGFIDSTFHTTDDAAGAATFVQKSSPDIANPGWGVQGLCSNPAAGIGQCWYDQLVYSPPGHPNIVYVGGVYVYGEQIANHRGVVMSEDGGTSWYDMTEDVTDDVHPNQLHPDQHMLVTNPSNPYQFFEVSDGGLVRSSGQLTDRSAVCDSRGLNPGQLNRCKQMLKKVPARLDSLNKGLQTLQFFTLSASPHKKGLLQGGTQDNGTWQTDGNPNTWLNTNISDGGQNGFDVAVPEFRFSMFFQPQVFVNYSDGSDADWLWISDTVYGGPGQAGNGETRPFYPSVIIDPKVSKTMFMGQNSVWRTKTAGQGSMSLAEFREQCNLWTGKFEKFCGDWVRAGSTSLTAAGLGDRSGGNVSMIERTSADNGTIWVGTSAGRVFISKNADAEPASAVAWDRLDGDSAISPGRFVTGISVDPANPNRAWVAYSGYSGATPATPGHVFEVTYNQGTGTATWARVDGEGTPGGLPDTPATDVLYDAAAGDLYVSNDFGVSLRASGQSGWTLAAPGMPNVMVPSLTLATNERVLYAATHGFGAWRLNLE